MVLSFFFFFFLCLWEKLFLSYHIIAGFLYFLFCHLIFEKEKRHRLYCCISKAWKLKAEAFIPVQREREREKGYDMWVWQKTNYERDASLLSNLRFFLHEWNPQQKGEYVIENKPRKKGPSTRKTWGCVSHRCMYVLVKENHECFYKIK